MFDNLTDNLTKIFDKLRGKGFISEQDLDMALREIRIILLEADVSLSTIKDFLGKIREKAIGAELIKSISPGQLIIKIVSDEIKEFLKSEEGALNLSAQPPIVFMMLGLQGSGKTTTTAKLALHLRQKHKKKVLLASLDTYRPAAQKQLEILAKNISIEVLPIIKDQQPVEIAKRALDEVKAKGFDILILDTAGRLHTDEDLIAELMQVKKLTNPIESLLVADAMTGQDAINIANDFNAKVGITGVILTRVDGDARGGAALSMKAATGMPIKFMGVGEKTSELEEFHADRIASRILGMGDVVSLVEKASEVVNQEEAAKMAQKLQKGTFDMNDMLSQFRSIKKMGGIGKIVGMIPGLGKMMQGANIEKNAIGRQEAIILSMTPKERRNPGLLNASRKIRIAKGSGTSVQDINKLMKQYITLLNVMKKFGKMSPSEMGKLERMFNV